MVERRPLSDTPGGYLNLPAAGHPPDRRPGTRRDQDGSRGRVTGPAAHDTRAATAGLSPGCGHPWAKLLAKEAMMSEPAAQFNIHDAKTNLSRIIKRVERGEEIIISRAGSPVAKVVRCPPRSAGPAAARCAAPSRSPPAGTPTRSTSPSPLTSA